ncbi:MAG: hypothetical protein AAGA84_06560 [Pseudomonadota bacterium]
MALTLATAGLLYAACVLLHHAHPKRSDINWVASDERAPTIMRWSAVVLIAMAQLLLAAAIGWERGIPVLLAVLAGAGVFSLLTATLASRAHVAGGLILFIVGVAGAGSYLTFA